MSKLGVPGYQTSDIDAPEIADKLTGAVPQATIVMCHIGGVLGYCAYAGRKGEIHGGTGGSLTRCWREADSNSRSRWELRCRIPISDLAQG